MIKRFLTLALFTAAAAVGQVSPVSPHCDQFLPYGYPIAKAQDTTPLCRISYYTLHDNARKVPVVSAEYLLPENVGGTVPRRDLFKADPNLPAGKRAELEDYDFTGYDRGHMAPANDMRTSTAAMAQTFYLSNMVPQEPGNNRGIWRSLEANVLSRAKKGERLYVLTGPIFDESPPQTIGSNRVAVPTALFKVVLNKDAGTVDSYIVPNLPAGYGSIQVYKTSVREVEIRARVNLMPLLSNDVKELVSQP